MMKLGVVMDPIAGITPYKDSTLAMMLEAQRRGYELRYMELSGLYAARDAPRAVWRPVTVMDDNKRWFELGEPRDGPLDPTEMDAILMRKDPPFDMAYVFATYLLELAERRGVVVVNRPQALRDANEKLFCAHFPQCTPPTLVTSDMGRMRAFLAGEGEIVVKPLDGFGGQGVFRLGPGDPNIGSVLETATARGTRLAMAQRYLPEIALGDKRILLVDGEPVPYALARVPLAGETRGNLAAGGRGEGRPLTERDRWIAAQVGPQARRRGLWFVGLDVIGDYLTEINVTSPTCIRELDAAFDLNIAGLLLRRVERGVRDRGR